MKRTPGIIAMLALTLTLPGCSTLFGKRFMAKADSQSAQPKPAPGAATYSLDLGRQHLDAGRNGLAIEAFQAALVTGESPAPAFNGLGVAFARLGRYDLAERYFQRATAIAPDDERYALNLAKLMRSPAFAMRHDADQVAQAEQAAAAPVAAAALTPAVAAIEPAGRIQRLGKGQVFIQSSAPQSAPMRTALATVDSRFKPVIRDEIAPIAEKPTEPEAKVKDIAPKSRVLNFKPLVRDQLPSARN